MDLPASPSATPNCLEKAADCFACFDKLPPEIRVRIWRSALPERGRIIQLTQYQLPSKAVAIGGTWPTSALSNREAFYETLNLRSTGKDAQGHPKRLAYFDFAKDVLCIDSCLLQSALLPGLQDAPVFSFANIFHRNKVYVEWLQVWKLYGYGRQVQYVVDAICPKQVGSIQKILLDLNLGFSYVLQLRFLMVDTQFKSKKVVGLVLNEVDRLRHLPGLIEDQEERDSKCKSLDIRLFMTKEEAAFFFAYEGTVSEYNKDNTSKGGTDRSHMPDLPQPPTLDSTSYQTLAEWILNTELDSPYGEKAYGLRTPEERLQYIAELTDILVLHTVTARRFTEMSLTNLYNILRPADHPPWYPAPLLAQAKLRCLLGTSQNVSQGLASSASG
ncbi:hypothetical protein BU16DRAFT_542612 [Lophium mytilinum]|uniref:2EXR domain-containing protein n=1 Tax=Lophium mytilinum TaxID=390894 RepID=A0A6A6QGF6_9PEZI|nr:hypothetical protein BU16DRAFT_542612 [Lophium mytilinum]